MSSSSTISASQALCLLALVVIVSIGAASAAKPLPGSCLMAASTLCANADTNAMRCLRKLAIAGDARVPAACSEAIMAGVTVNPRLNQASRAKRMSRMLNEAPATCNAGNNCPSTWGAVQHNRCNDVQNGCSGCPHGTFTIPAGSTTRSVTVVTSKSANPLGINCANICCKDDNGNGACCFSYSSAASSSASVYCNGASHFFCNIGG